MGKGIGTLTACLVFYILFSAEYSVKINVLGFVLALASYVGERVDSLGVLLRTNSVEGGLVWKEDVVV